MSADALYSYVYVSSAARLFTDEELVALLRTSRENNERESITGMLLYRDGNFMQAIEGPEEAVRALADRIGRDRRHRGVLRIVEGAAAERQFPGWTMGFAHVDQLTETGEGGVSDLLGSFAPAPALARDPGRALRLLVGFRDALR